jgi:hypothetical protein
MSSPLTTSFPRSECGLCRDEAWVECGSCSRWFCGPCSRKGNGGQTACPRCYPPMDRSGADGEDP